MAFLSPTIGTVAAGWAISLTTFAAVVGRMVTSFIVDQFDRRIISGLNFIIQMLGMAMLAMAATPITLYLGCALFGLGSGNLTSLPGLLVQQEFPKHHFARIVSLVVAINQFSFAFGPTVLGQLEAAQGSYRLGLLICLSIEAVAAIIVVAPVVLGGRERRRVRGRSDAGLSVQPADGYFNALLVESPSDTRFDHPRNASSTAVSSKSPQNANRIRLSGSRVANLTPAEIAAMPPRASGNPTTQSTSPAPA
jgi:MFS family permease